MNAIIPITVDGAKWTLTVDRKTGSIKVRKFKHRVVYEVTPSRLVELAIGQKVMPFAHEVTVAPQQKVNDYTQRHIDLINGLSSHPAGKALLEATGHVAPTHVQTSFA